MIIKELETKLVNSIGRSSKVIPPDHASRADGRRERPTEKKDKAKWERKGPTFEDYLL